MQRIVENVQKGKRPEFVPKNGILRYESRLCTDVAELNDEILREARSFGNSIHSDSTKMYWDLHGNLWNEVKRDHRIRSVVLGVSTGQG